jgi:hypothetical protein
MAQNKIVVSGVRETFRGAVEKSGPLPALPRVHGTARFGAAALGLKIILLPCERALLHESFKVLKIMRHIFKIIALAASLNLLLTTRVFAGPPFLTDDPEPVDYQHWEAYLFGNGDHTSGGYIVNGPAVEINYGALPDTQLHLIVPMTTVGGDGMPMRSGLGDTEFGIKYRFRHETNGWPQIGIFPMVELPTGDEARGLGNGRAWFRLPLWLQKSFGAWTTYGGGGAVLNSAPGQHDYSFSGWLLQRDFGPHLTLGGEIFGQGKDADDDHGFAALNFGGSYNINEHFSLLFSAGHSVAGDQHMLWYFGFYSTW